GAGRVLAAGGAGPAPAARRGGEVAALPAVPRRRGAASAPAARAGGHSPRRVAVRVRATARPELLERRPGWGAGGATVRLEPLGDGDTTGLLATLLAHPRPGGGPAEGDAARAG